MHRSDPSPRFPSRFEALWLSLLVATMVAGVVVAYGKGVALQGTSKVVAAPSDGAHGCR